MDINNLPKHVQEIIKGEELPEKVIKSLIHAGRFDKFKVVRAEGLISVIIEHYGLYHLIQYHSKLDIVTSQFIFGKVLDFILENGKF